MDKNEAAHALRGLMPMDVETLASAFVPSRALIEAERRYAVEIQTRYVLQQRRETYVADELSDMIRAARMVNAHGASSAIRDAYAAFREIWPEEPHHEAAKRMLAALERGMRNG